MKTKILAILISSIILISLAVFLLLPNKKETTKVENIKEMTFNMINGQSIDDIISYSIVCNNECNFEYSKGEKVVKKEILNEEKLTKLEDILNKYNVSSWNGFEKDNNDVLDGKSFGFSVYMENGHNIIASGYASFPDNYYDVVNEIEILFGTN